MSGTKYGPSIPFSRNAKLFGRRILPFSDYEQQMKRSYEVKGHPWAGFSVISKFCEEKMQRLQRGLRPRKLVHVDTKGNKQRGHTYTEKRTALTV